MMRRLFFMVCSSLLWVNLAWSVDWNTLLPDEKNTIEIFQNASSKVVHVHRIATVIDRHHEKKQVPDGSGSGIVWDKLGHIVTNYHVIRNADQLTVSVGLKTFPAKIIATEPRKDLAVLMIKSPEATQILKDITPFEITSLKNLMVGQKTIAIGNPFGLDHSLTTGVISALGRKVPGVGGVTIHDMVQTDASINPGNSGGPLLDSAGHLIGLNTVIFSQSGSSSGVGFAVPSEEIVRVVSQIIQHGRVQLAGIGIHQVEPKLALKLGVEHGILVAEVLPHTPAAKVGLRGTIQDKRGRLVLGDIIVALNGQSVDNYDELYNLLSDIKIGSMVTLSVLRNDVPIQFKMRTIDIAAY